MTLRIKLYSCILFVNIVTKKYPPLGGIKCEVRRRGSSVCHTWHLRFKFNSLPIAMSTIQSAELDVLLIGKKTYDDNLSNVMAV